MNFHNKREQKSSLFYLLQQKSEAKQKITNYELQIMIFLLSLHLYDNQICRYNCTTPIGTNLHL